MTEPTPPHINDPGIGPFFMEIAVVVGSTAITWAIWQLFKQQFTFGLWVLGLIGVGITVVGAWVGVADARSWPHRILRLVMFPPVAILIFKVCWAFYVDDLGYPQNSTYLKWLSSSVIVTWVARKGCLMPRLAYPVARSR